MAVVALMMLPPYLDNARLARSMQEFATQEGSAALSEDVIRAQLAERAAKLGLPLDPKQIRVEKAEGRLRVEAIYTVRVDLPVYSVDLHFRPSAVSR